MTAALAHSRLFKITFNYETSLNITDLKPVTLTNGGADIILSTGEGNVTAYILLPEIISNLTYAYAVLQYGVPSSAGYIKITSYKVEGLSFNDEYQNTVSKLLTESNKRFVDATTYSIIGDTFVGKGVATRTGNKLIFSGGSYSGQAYIGVIVNRSAEIEKLRGKTIKISMNVDISGDIRNILTPQIMDSNGVLELISLLYSNHNLSAIIKVPSTGTLSYLGLVLVNNVAIDNLLGINSGDYIEITDYKIELLDDVEYSLLKLDSLYQRTESSYLRINEPRFFYESSEYVTYDDTTKTITANQTIAASHYYVGYRYDNSTTFGDGAILDISFTVNTTGSTNWVLAVSGSTSGVIELLLSEYLDDIVHLQYKIIDAASCNFLYFYMNTSNFVSGSSITIGDAVVKDLSLNNIIRCRYADKTLTCFGDSYTMQQKWQPYVCNELGMAAFSDAWGQSGGTLTSIYTQINTVNSNADVLTIWIGTNDYSGSRRVGEINDTVASSLIDGFPSYCGALNYVCDWISLNMPGKTIIFITPTFRYDSTDEAFEESNGTNEKGYVINNSGYTLEDYANAMIAVANKWGYPCLDLFHTSGINKNTEMSYYDTDRLHPSWAGAKILAHKIAKFINEQ